ncbi:hypothetical protein J6590_030601 [Homalodisca vitripennis]|nr:hypothetical protein J6590_030601 [Homalodisca vitripennis]
MTSSLASLRLPVPRRPQQSSTSDPIITHIRRLPLVQDATGNFLADNGHTRHSCCSSTVADGTRTRSRTRVPCKHDDGSVNVH